MKIFKNYEVSIACLDYFLIKSRAWGGGSGPRTPIKEYFEIFPKFSPKMWEIFYKIFIKIMKNWPKIVIFYWYFQKFFLKISPTSGGRSSPERPTRRPPVKHLALSKKFLPQTPAPCQRMPMTPPEDLLTPPWGSSHTPWASERANVCYLLRAILGGSLV